MMQAVQTHLNDAQEIKVSRLPVSSVPTSNKPQKYAFDIAAYRKHDNGRCEVEEFIQHGFAKSYGAKIQVSMPWVLAIRNGSFKAALGIRPATEPLFLEQYLDAPIEDYFKTCETPTSRAKIAEIGHLYSNSNKFTIPLFLTTAVSLFYNQYDTMVFSATEQVLALIDKTGIPYQQLGQADPAKLTPCADQWGTYYDSHPTVVAVSLHKVMQVISHNSRYNSMFDKLQARIAATSKTLKGTEI